MTKFHISAAGDPAPCKAVQGKCPLGDSTAHGEFESKDDARAWAEDFVSKLYGGGLASTSKSEPATPQSFVTEASHTVTGLDITVDEKDVAADGRLKDPDVFPNIRYERVPDETSSSGWPQWKLYGSEEDLKSYLEMNEYDTSEGVQYDEFNGDKITFGKNPSAVTSNVTEEGYTVKGEAVLAQANPKLAYALSEYIGSGDGLVGGDEINARIASGSWPSRNDARTAVASLTAALDDDDLTAKDVDDIVFSLSAAESLGLTNGADREKIQSLIQRHTANGKLAKNFDRQSVFNNE